MKNMVEIENIERALGRKLGEVIDECINVRGLELEAVAVFLHMKWSWLIAGMEFDDWYALVERHINRSDNTGISHV